MAGTHSLSDCVVFGLSSADSAKEYVLQAAAADTADTAADADADADAADDAGHNAVIVIRTLEEEGGQSQQRQSSSSGASGDSSSSGTGKEGAPAGKKKSIVVINGQHYDITAFAAIHPGGALDTEDGEDISARYAAAHGQDMGLLDRDSVKKVRADGTGKTATQNVFCYSNVFLTPFSLSLSLSHTHTHSLTPLYLPASTNANTTTTDQL
jgi:hypothetical protein